MKPETVVLLYLFVLLGYLSMFIFICLLTHELEKIYFWTLTHDCLYVYMCLIHYLTKKTKSQKKEICIKRITQVHVKVIFVYQFLYNSKGWDIRPRIHDGLYLLQEETFSIKKKSVKKCTSSSIKISNYFIFLFLFLHRAFFCTESLNSPKTAMTCPLVLENIITI